MAPKNNLLSAKPAEGGLNSKNLVPISQAPKCPWCGGDSVFIETPNLIHYGKNECSQCGKWIEWVSNPDKTGRTKTTKCNVTYDFCKICLRDKTKIGYNETLEAHHIIPLDKGGEDKIENILIVCSACHKLINWVQLYMHTHLNKHYEKKDGEHNNPQTTSET